jgi:hypothetical protein
MDERERRVSGMILTGATELAGTKPVPVSLCPPKIPQELAWEQTRASALKVGD